MGIDLKANNRFKTWLGRSCIRGAALLAICVMMAAPTVSHGFSLYDKGDVTADLDSTLSWGFQYRVQERANNIIGRANGGDAYSVNYDDGNLNYDRGIVSNAVKLTSELDVKTRNYGAFFRGSAFYDYETMEGDRERYELSDEAEKAVGMNASLLDAYVWADHDFGSIPVQIRVGEQVVSWGEGTFIMGSINDINPVDVSKIRVPGAELKEALVPEGMVWASVGVTENITVEGLYLYDWEETKIDAPGTFFATADFAGPGGYKLLPGMGAFADGGNASVANTPFAVARDHDKEADDQGQYGAAVRALVPALNDTEFGFYYLHYHMRAPRLGVRTGTVAGALAAAVSLNPYDYTRTAGYFLKYVEDVDLYGLSFSTELFGWGLQGEVSYRPDYPLQIDDNELLFSALGLINPLIGAAAQLGPATAFDTPLKECIERDQYQTQATVTKILNPGFLGYDSGVILGEIGWVHVDDMPSKDELLLEGSGTFTPGGAAGALYKALAGTPVAPDEGFADADSWGYRLLAKVNYYNAIGPLTLSPRVAFSHDVDGNSPYGGPFQQHRKAVTLGLGAGRATWSADLSYTTYFGNETMNLRHDRDFVGFNVKYSF
jgi:Protein of unknown function (DUF1302)